MPCPSTNPRMFCASLKIHIDFMPVQNSLFCFVFFFAGSKVLEEALKCDYVFGLAQNLLGLVEGQGITHSISQFCKIHCLIFKAKMTYKSLLQLCK